MVDGARRRSGFQDTHDVFFAHDQDFLTINLDGLAGVLAEQNAIADLDVEGDVLAGVVALARTDSQHFTLIRLFTSGIGDDDAGSGGALGFDALDDDTVVQRTDIHRLTPDNE